MIPPDFAFIKYHDLDPVTNEKCIYYTSKGVRCGCDLEEDDRTDAKLLAHDLTELIRCQNKSIAFINRLRKYARRNCCRHAFHRDFIKERGELDDLTNAWVQQIYDQLAATDDSAYQNSDTDAPLVETLVLMPEIENPGTVLLSSDANATVDESGANDTTLILDPLSTPRYNLRSRDLEQKSPWSETVLSEFRPHIKRPRANENIAWRLRQRVNLEKPKRCSKTSGSIYIFDRGSSPGFVKIGFTTNEVRERLRAWQKRCGYIPQLLDSCDDVPNVWRVETLIHYELINEWRRERRCKMCMASHKEWFEIDLVRAVKVMHGWARFMIEVQPYSGPNGDLDEFWLGVLDRCEKDGRPITAEALLQIHGDRLGKQQTKLIEDEAIPTEQKVSMKVERSQLDADQMEAALKRAEGERKAIKRERPGSQTPDAALTESENSERAQLVPKQEIDKEGDGIDTPTATTTVQHLPLIQEHTEIVTAIEQVTEMAQRLLTLSAAQPETSITVDQHSLAAVHIADTTSVVTQNVWETTCTDSGKPAQAVMVLGGNTSGAKAFEVVVSEQVLSVE